MTAIPPTAACSDTDLPVSYAAAAAAGGTAAVPSDTEIARTVREALEHHVVVPHQHIQTAVENGRVTLEGRVPYGYQRHDAELAVCRLPGVRGVENRITVIHPEIDLATVRQAIAGALERKGAQDGANRVHVKTKGGTVVLTGHVGTWFEKQAILGAIHQVSGVQEVEDHLGMDAYPEDGGARPAA